jgi:predicted Zn-dependent protease
MKRLLPLLAACLCLSSCVGITKSLSDAAASAGVSSDVTKGLSTAAVAAEDIGADIKKANAEITPEQEYYIGRAVGATIFSQYKAYDKKALNDYLNRLGQSLSLYSERPEVFGGYHFAALDSGEINAFATPSGLVMVSRGLIGITSSEDELAAVLAHELGHVTCKHGLNSIRSARYGPAIAKTAKLAGSAAGSLVGAELKELTGAFADSIGDISKTMLQSGYSKSAEFEADQKAVKILKESGYDPRALERVLRAMVAKLDPKEAKGFSKTHPKPQDRIKALKTALDAVKAASPPPNQAQKDRYAQAMKAN